MLLSGPDFYSICIDHREMSHSLADRFSQQGGNSCLVENICFRSDGGTLGQSCGRWHEVVASPLSGWAVEFQMWGPQGFPKLASVTTSFQRPWAKGRDWTYALVLALLGVCLSDGICRCARGRAAWLCLEVRKVGNHLKIHDKKSGRKM